jgi:hypothetical protein
VAKVSKGVIAAIVLCVHPIDGLQFFNSELARQGCCGKFVYDEPTAEQVGLLPTDGTVQVFKTPAYKASPNMDIELTLGIQNVDGKDMQFVTVDGTIYPCDRVQPYLCSGFIVGLTLTLSYGFTVDVQACHISYNVKRRYNTIYKAKVVRCE